MWVPRTLLSRSPRDVAMLSAEVLVWCHLCRGCTPGVAVFTAVGPGVWSSPHEEMVVFGGDGLICLV